MLDSAWKSVQFFFQGDAFFDGIFKDIESARFRVWIEVYIFEYDLLGQVLVDKLVAAKKRGLDVKVLVDGVGSWNALDNLQAVFEKNKIEFHVYHKVYWLDFLKKTKIWKLNKRNHRKIFLIDQAVYIGSFNVTQVHSERINGDKAWRDSGIKATGPCIDELESAMKVSWEEQLLINLPSLKRKKVNRKWRYCVRMNLNLKERFLMVRDLKRRIKRAKARLLITNPYFLPRRGLFRAILQALRNGAYVGLCLPEKTDVKILQWAARGLYYELLKSGAMIFEYKPTVLHSKTIVVDNWASIGSHNWNHRSLIHDLEIEAAFENPQWIDQLLNQWDKDVRVSSSVTLQSLGKLPWWEKLLGKFFYWLRYWL